MGKPTNRTEKQKSIDAAQRKIRSLQREMVALDACIKEQGRVRRRLEDTVELLAMLAADGPAFLSPVTAAAGIRERDKILARLGMKPDGSPILPTEPTP